MDYVREWNIFKWLVGLMVGLWLVGLFILVVKLNGGLISYRIILMVSVWSSLRMSLVVMWPKTMMTSRKTLPSLGHHWIDLFDQERIESQRLWTDRWTHRRIVLRNQPAVYGLISDDIITNWLVLDWMLNNLFHKRKRWTMIDCDRLRIEIKKMAEENLLRFEMIIE